MARLGKLFLGVCRASDGVWTKDGVVRRIYLERGPSRSWHLILGAWCFTAWRADW